MAQFATLEDPARKVRPEIVNGRYRIPDRSTRKPKSWTRATTFAKSIADEYHLTRWKLRMTAAGLVVRQDLYAAVASSLPLDLTDQTKDEKARLNQLCDDAMDAAGSAKGSNLGTALHDFTDSVDSGRTPTIPPPWDADIAAYRTAMTAAGITVLPPYIEQVVTVEEFGVAGKFDRIVRHAGRHVIADLKTAKSLDLGWGEIAIQLALYAHADTIFDPATGTHQPMPEVDRERALVMHLPVGQATCTIYEVDIAAGWEAAQLCAQVRSWRTRKGLAQQINAITHAPEAATNVITMPVPPSPTDPFTGLPGVDGRPQIDRAAKRAWLLERREALIAIAGGRDALAARWPVVDGTPIPTLIAFDDHTTRQLALITQAITDAEADVQALFPGRPDPTDPAHIKVADDDPRVVALREKGQALPPDLQKQVFRRAREAKVPRLDAGRLTEAHVIELDRIITAAAADAAPRLQKIAEALEVAAEHGATETDLLCDVLRFPDARHLHGRLVDLFIDLVDTLAHPDRILVADEGGLVVDRPAVVLDAFNGDRRRLLAAGREVAKRYGIESPRDSDAVLAHPLLVSAVFMAETGTSNTQPNPTSKETT